MAKNINGEGTITARRNKRGTVYDVRLSVRDRRTGLTERIFKGGFTTQKEAVAWRDSVKRKSKAEGIVRGQTLMVPELVATWLRMAPPDSPSTIKGYSYMLERHIKPRLDIAAAQLDKATLKAFLAGTLAVCVNGPGHAANRQCLSILKAAYRWGAMDSVGMVQAVPDCLRSRGLTPKAGRGKPLSLDAVAALMAAARPDSYILWRLLLETGARKGEILGLNWSDVDFNNGLISIRKIASPESNGVELAPRTKGKAFREVSLSQGLLALLQNRRGMPEEALFPGGKGKARLSFSTVSRWWVRDCAAAGIAGMGYTPHSLRHTWATTALNNGVPVTVVSAVLGHAQVSTTVNIYSHDTEEQRSAASALVANIFAF